MSRPWIDPAVAEMRSVCEPEIRDPKYEGSKWLRRATKVVRGEKQGLKFLKQCQRIFLQKVMPWHAVVVVAAAQGIHMFFGTIDRLPRRGALVPGLGHAVRGNGTVPLFSWEPSAAMFAFGLHLNGRLFGPDFTDLFSVLKFIAGTRASVSPIGSAWHKGTGPRVIRRPTPTILPMCSFM